ncbi:thiolase family protein [Pseudohoeflea coraliihabitans]|uniref:Thiolase family protein n=1 Tax=Pseudohoeflea coraliihabitans TaxID=2860393 RepID=A0ABS6WKF2_9HYPH|nr:thiolase family protein [Pseudohoeflea sp. DP4N28-3]MBW3096431.1 thiolase family protein [Pseudohoeflea sp. DP4N28-3]
MYGGSQVHVIGGAMTPFGKHPDQTAERLAQRAVLDALADAGLRRDAIEAAYVGSVFQGSLAGQRVLKDLGMTGVPIYNLENACSSGGTALAQACLAVAAGQVETALVVGMEMLSTRGSGPLALSTGDPEIEQGLTMPALYAMRTRAYLDKYDGSIEGVAQVTVKNRRHAAGNKNAQFRDPCTVEEVLASRPVADPITLLQMCPNADGAAALIVSSKPPASGKSVKVLGSVVASGRFAQGHRDLTVPDITIEAAKKAYEMAGLGPEDVDLAEVHDAAAIAEVVYYEALGFCGAGEGLALLAAGDTAIGGKIPVNPSGGLLCRGHPLGATGVAQAVEMLWQLTGRAEGHQVEGAKVGLAHCTGGGIWGVDNGACTVHLMGV